MDRDDLITKNALIVEYLTERQVELAPVVHLSLEKPSAAKLDFSKGRLSSGSFDIRDTTQLSIFLHHQLEAAGASIGIGGYLEQRDWYARSGVFSASDEIRSIHLGVDIWTQVGERVFNPLEGRVHSFQDNASFGDYGPTIIVEHETPRGTLYSLYGHLSRESLTAVTVGKTLLPGQVIGAVGSAPINGDWPPHLHFQLILDMQGMRGDFPGVCTTSRIEEFSMLCPNPNLVLGSSLL